jgi:hypothetical protein
MCRELPKLLPGPLSPPSPPPYPIPWRTTLGIFPGGDRKEAEGNTSTGETKHAKDAPKGSPTKTVAFIPHPHGSTVPGGCWVLCMDKKKAKPKGRTVSEAPWPQS